MAWMPSKDRQDALKLAMVLTMGRLNLLLSSSSRQFLTSSLSMLSSFIFSSLLDRI